MGILVDSINEERKRRQQQRKTYWERKLTADADAAERRKKQGDSFSAPAPKTAEEKEAELNLREANRSVKYSMIPEVRAGAIKRAEASGDTEKARELSFAKDIERWADSPAVREVAQKTYEDEFRIAAERGDESPHIAAFEAGQDVLDMYGSMAQKAREDLYNYRQEGKKKDIENVRSLPDFADSVRAGATVTPHTFGKASEILDYMNGDETYRAQKHLIASKGATQYWLGRNIDEMSEDEKNVIRYYASKGEMDKVKEYYELLERDLNRRVTVEQNNTAEKNAYNLPVLGAVANVASSFGTPAGYVKNLVQTGKNAITGEYEPTDTNAPTFSYAHAARATSDGVTQRAYDAAGGGTWGEIASFAAGTGLSLANYASKLPLGPTGAMIAMSADTAGQKTLDVLERGGTQGEALFLSTAAAALEALTEKLPLENLFKTAKQVGKKGLKQAIKSSLKQAGMEATEEMVSEIANTALDIAVMRDKSEYQKYISELVKDGTSRAEAEKEAFFQYFGKNVLLAGAGGALSGGIMGGGASAISGINTAINRSRAGGGFTPTEYSKKITNKQIRALRSIGRALGVNISIGAPTGNGEGAYNGYYQNGNIVIAQDAENPLEVVLCHEITHHMKMTAPAEYNAFLELAVNASESLSSTEKSELINRYKTEYSKGTQTEYSDAQALDEIAADFASRIVNDVKMFDRLAKSNRGAAVRFIDGIKDFIAKVKSTFSADKAKADTASQEKYGARVSELETAVAQFESMLATTEEAVASGNINTTGTNAGGRRMYSIKTNPKGKYVKADRHVVEGKTPEEWGESVKRYINDTIRQGADVQVIADNGDILTITADSAGKAKFRNYVKRPDGTKTRMTDTEYLTKLNAESHIDELSKISKKGKKDVRDYKNHDFAKDGFNYRTAYFQDFDGKYYKLTLSVGKNGEINTVYNVGKINEAPLPLVAQRPDTKGVGGDEASTNSIPHSSEKSNRQNSLKTGDLLSPDYGKTAVAQFESMLATTEEAVASGNINTAGTNADGGRMYGISENGKSLSRSEEYSYEKLTRKKDMELTQLDSNAPNNRADIIAKAKKNAAQIGRVNEQNNIAVVVDDIGKEVIIGTDGLKHSLNRGKGLEKNPNSFATLRIGEILKNSIRINELTPSKNTASGAYVLIGAAKNIDGDIYIIRSVVNEYSNELTSIDVLYAVNTKKESAAQNAPRYAERPLSVTDSKIRISHLLDYVNKYFPDVLPESVLRHYGYDTRPDGDLGKDALFSLKTGDLLSPDYEKTAVTAEDPSASGESYIDETGLDTYFDDLGERAQTTETEKIKAVYKKQRERELRGQIIRATKKLDQTLRNPTDKKHILKELQKPVANLLRAINLEGMSLEYGSDAKYHRVESDSPYGEPTNRTQAFRELKKIYERIGGEDSTITISPELLEGNAEGRGKLFEKIIEMQDIPLYAMSEEQLRMVWTALRAVENSVRTANKMFTSKRGETVEKVAKSIRDGAKMKNTRVDIAGLSKIRKLVTLDTMTPENFFHRLGSGGDSVFRMLRDAQDKKTLLWERAIDFSSKLVADKKISKLEKITHKVILGGEEIELSTAQLMELYVLTRREQATEHIFKGGIRPEELPGIKKLVRSSVVRHVTQQEVGIALDKLSPEEKKIAEKLSDFTSSVLGAEMNKACLNVFGYEKFGEKNYWPIRTVETSLKTDEKQAGGRKTAPSIRNFGMANATTPKAKTPLKIGSIFDTFTSHTAEATTYAAYLEATEDLRRIINYTFFDDEGGTIDTMKEVVEKAFGKGGLQYWLNLDEDISGGMSGDDGGFFDTALRNTKAARIAGNIRVVAQQPTAVLRAGSMIDYKYLLEGMAHSKRGWERAVKYSPIAKWKSYGFFDSNTGPRMKELLFGQSSGLGKVRELGMKGTELADSFGWGVLWSACEAELEAKIKRAENKKTPAKTGVGSLDRVLNEYGIAKLNDYVNVQKSVLEQLEKEEFFGSSGSISVQVKENGMSVEIGKSGIKETLGPGKRFQQLGRLLKLKKLAAIKKLPEIIANAHVLSLDNPNEHNSGSGAKYGYLESETVIDGEPHEVKITLRQVPGKNKFWMHVIEIKNASGNNPAETDNFGTGYQNPDADGIISHDNDDVNKDIKPGTDEFYNEVAKRFTEIVDHTQVVDGVLQRSQIMRSSNAIDKMATSYLAEPTKTVNMFASALRDFAQTEKGEARKEAGKKLARTSMSLLVSFAVNAALGQSLVDAIRDDDKDKKYWERWLSAFGENMTDAVNPLQYFPYIKDVASLLQGYSIERMDMDGIENIIEAGKNLIESFSGESKLSTAGTLNNMCAVVGTMFGLGTANVKRDVRAVVREIAVATDSYVVEYLMAKATYSIKYEKNRGDFYDILRRAYENDKEAYNIICSDMVKNGFKKEDIGEKMKTQTVRGKFQDAVNAAKKTKEAKNAVPADKIVYRHLNREKNAIRGTSAADQNTILDNLPKYRESVEKYLKKYPGRDEEKKLEYAYREANRALYGEEYAIRVNGGSDVYKKAEEKVKRGKTTWKKYYDEYFGKTERRFDAVSDRFNISYAEFEKIESAISKNGSKAEEISAIEKLGYKNSIARRIYTLYHDTK